MRIFYTGNESPLILDSVSGFNVLHQKLQEFLTSLDRTIRIQASTSGDPAPYAMFLDGIEFVKGAGPIFVSVIGKAILRISGSPDNLQHYIASFRFRNDEDGSHHHPEQLNRIGFVRPDSLTVIVEADNARLSEMSGDG